MSCVLDDERLHFKDGDFVDFSEVKVMNEFSDGKPRNVEIGRPYYFHVHEDTTNFGCYKMGGIIAQARKSKLLNFHALKEALEGPSELILNDSPCLTASPCTLGCLNPR